MHPRAFFSFPRGASKPSSVLHETINENLESTVLAPSRPYIYCPKGPNVTWTTHTHISKLYSLLFSPGKKSKLHMNRKFVIIVKNGCMIWSGSQFCILNFFIFFWRWFEPGKYPKQLHYYQSVKKEEEKKKRFCRWRRTQKMSEKKIKNVLSGDADDMFFCL